MNVINIWSNLIYELIKVYFDKIVVCCIYQANSGLFLMMEQ